MTLKSDENRLFEKWPVAFPSDARIVKDGLVDEPAWLASRIKLLFILKEAHDSPKTGKRGGWDLRCFLKGGAVVSKEKNVGTKGGGGSTWNNITRWALIANEGVPYDCKSLSHISPKRRAEGLRSICAINLKKLPGSAKANPKTLWQAAKNDADLLLKQIDLYLPFNPLIVACGKDVSRILKGALNIGAGPPSRKTPLPEGVERIQHGGHLLHWVHPNARMKKTKLATDWHAALQKLSDLGAATGR